MPTHAPKANVASPRTDVSADDHQISVFADKTKGNRPVFVCDHAPIFANVYANSRKGKKPSVVYKVTFARTIPDGKGGFKPSYSYRYEDLRPLLDTIQHAENVIADFSSRGETGSETED
jgi:hypothetical protein